MAFFLFEKKTFKIKAACIDMVVKKQKQLHVKIHYEKLRRFTLYQSKCPLWWNIFVIHEIWFSKVLWSQLMMINKTRTTCEKQPLRRCCKRSMTLHRLSEGGRWRKVKVWMSSRWLCGHILPVIKALSHRPHSISHSKNVKSFINRIKETCQTALWNLCWCEATSATWRTFWI